jgi:hypothetical protein
MSYLLWKKVKEHSQATAVENKPIIHLRAGVEKATRIQDILII